MRITFDIIDDTGRRRRHPPLHVTSRELVERDAAAIAQAEVDVGLPNLDLQASEWDDHPRLDPDSIRVRA